MVDVYKSQIQDLCAIKWNHVDNFFWQESSILFLAHLHNTLSGCAGPRQISHGGSKLVLHCRQFDWINLMSKGTLKMNLLLLFLWFAYEEEKKIKYFHWSIWIDISPLGLTFIALEWFYIIWGIEYKWQLYTVECCKIIIGVT